MLWGDYLRSFSIYSIDTHQMECALLCFRQYLCSGCILSLAHDYISFSKSQLELLFGKDLYSLGTFLKDREGMIAFVPSLLFMEI